MNDINRRRGETEGAQPVVTPTRARQGARGHNVRLVLAFGTIGAVAALALTYFLFFTV
jgi:hypothetical protein